MLFKTKVELDALQKRVDLSFIDAINKSMDGVNVDYSELDNNTKIYYYHLLEYNLQHAMDLFFNSSYKDNQELYNVIQKLHFFIKDNYGDDYTIEEDVSYNIYKHLIQIMFNPNNMEAIEGLKSFIKDK
jgi:hypothetical protein